LDIDTAALDRTVDAALDCYGAVPASGLAATAQADMLRFQFGVYDGGHGEHFEFDIARQFIVDAEGEDAIGQRRCVMFYEPTMAPRSIASATAGATHEMSWRRSQA
jgi:hypothetical protein